MQGRSPLPPAFLEVVLTGRTARRGVEGKGLPSQGRPPAVSRRASRSQWPPLIAFLPGSR